MDVEIRMADDLIFRHASGKRLVHDLLTENRGSHTQINPLRRPIAFVQWGTEANDFLYQGVCPFCGNDTGWVESKVVNATIGGLYRCLLQLQKKHWYGDSQNPGCQTVNNMVKDFAVQITTKPLRTEKKPEIKSRWTEPIDDSPSEQVH